MTLSSRRTRLRRRRSANRINALRVAALLLIALVMLTVSGVATAVAVVQSWLSDLPDYKSPEAFKMAEPTLIFAADGTLLARLYLEDRTVVDISKISTDLVDAVVAIEDERFYKHNGVDTEGIVRAVFKNLASGDLTGEGASTITMQYIRNTVLLNERTQITLARKIREAYLAMEVEKQYSKQQILGLYLNTVYWGEGAYGAEAAARNYFGKHASDLTLGEASLLAGVLQGPTRLNPYENPERALQRRTQVLGRMVANGYISQTDYETAKSEPLVLKRWDEPMSGIYAAPYFVSHVKKQLQQKYPQSVVFKGGLKVYTTIDMKMQQIAEKTVKQHLGKATDPDTALVSIDPRSGHIKAMYGGKDYSKNKFNLATQGRRQPGSSFKTFVLATALEEGMPPTRLLDSSSPAFIPTKPKAWEVSNSEGTGRGMVTMATATKASINTAFARLIWELGAAKVADVAHRMGITSDLPPYPSIALGSGNVTPLEMASAYGTLATNGLHHKPIAITRVLDSAGKEIFVAESEPAKALEPAIARAATDVLTGVVQSGTGTRANIGRPQAGKTGTSQNYRDAWFVGYTPDLVTSVWVGYYKTETPMKSVNGRRGFGGTLAAPIWGDFMKAALAGKPKLQFPKAPKPKYERKAEWFKGSKVPAVVGKTLKEAEAALEDAGLTYTVKQVYDAKVAAGRVARQSPAAGKSVGSDGVTLYVSKGPDPQVPPPPPDEPPPPPPEPTSTPSP